MQVDWWMQIYARARIGADAGAGAGAGATVQEPEEAISIIN